MTNMSYCRFENTASDFYDCIRALRTMQENQGLEEEGHYTFTKLSPSEKIGLYALLDLCSEYKEEAEELIKNHKE